VTPIPKSHSKIACLYITVLNQTPSALATHDNTPMNDRTEGKTLPMGRAVRKKLAELTN
jgi:hypothetical protein